MQNDPQAAYITRDSILKLLSDDEVARVSTAETAGKLSPGEQYLDLEHIDRGVRVATLTRDMSTANLLPKRAVADETWRKILNTLAAPPVGERLGQDEYAVAIYDTHVAAEAAIKALQHAGVDMTRLSIVGKDFRTEERPLGFYNVGNRMAFWGGQGAFWGSLWGMLFGSALFFIPTIGPIIVMGPLVTWIVGTLEGAALGGTLGVVGAALASIGMPADAVIAYEHDLRAGKFLVVAHGKPAMIQHCRSILAFAPTQSEASAE
jgi:hypothetical protein